MLVLLKTVIAQEVVSHQQRKIVSKAQVKTAKMVKKTLRKRDISANQAKTLLRIEKTHAVEQAQYVCKAQIVNKTQKERIITKDATTKGVTTSISVIESSRKAVIITKNLSNTQVRSVTDKSKKINSETHLLV